MPSKSGSTPERNSCDGSPPHSALNIALCPAEQRERLICPGRVSPTRIAGIRSQCSTKLDAAWYTSGSVRARCSIFEKSLKGQKDIDWYFSFYHDYVWPIKESERIEIRPFDNIDVKYVWEFNRHQFLHHLGIAYYLTGEEKYAKKFKVLLLDWIKKNPPLYGINWGSGLDISIRLIRINNKVIF